MTSLDYLYNHLRQHDYDRYLSCLYSPKSIRDQLATLYAWNHEIAKIPGVVKEPAAGYLRLTWWRDSLQKIQVGEKVDHPIAEFIKPILDLMPLDDFINIINAREKDVEGTDFAMVEDVLEYGKTTAGCLNRIVLRIEKRSELTREELSVCDALGQAWSILNLIKNLPYQFNRELCYLPLELLYKNGVSKEEFFSVNRGQVKRALNMIVKELLKTSEGLMSCRMPSGPINLQPLNHVYLKKLYKHEDHYKPIYVSPLRKQLSFILKF